MRYVALVLAALIAVGVSPASAASKLKFHSQTTVIVSAPLGIAVPDTSNVLAAAGDIIGCGTACMRYDLNGNMYVTLAGASGITVGFPYSMTADAQTATAASAIGLGVINGGGTVDRVAECASPAQTGCVQVQLWTGTNSIGRLQPSAGHWAGALFASTVGGSGTLAGGVQGCATGPAVPCAFIACSGACVIYGFEFLSGSAMVASQTVTCYNNATALSGSQILTAAQMGSDQIISIGGANGLSVAGVTCQLNGTLLSSQDFVVFTQP